MKKMLLVILCLILVSCTNSSDDFILDEYGKIIIIEDYKYVGTFENEDEIYIKPYRVLIQDAALNIIIVRNDVVLRSIGGSPSYPKLNKERNKIIYVDSLEVETIGNITIYDSETELESHYTE